MKTFTDQHERECSVNKPSQTDDLQNDHKVEHLSDSLHKNVIF